MKRPADLANRVLFAAFALAASGCHPAHRQSALHPAADAAARIATLWWVMFAALALSFVVVVSLVLAAIRRRPAAVASLPRLQNRLVVFGGFAFPAVVLTGMLFYSLGTSLALHRPAEGLRVQVIGRQWWWDVRYPGHDVVTANEIHVPVGEPIVFELLSADVIHSFWIPGLHGKMDMLPEAPTRLVVTVDRPGRWRGQCAEFCGRQHAWMAFELVALPRPEFEAWIARHPSRAPAPEPESPPPEISLGREIFFRESCHTCHRVAGTRAEGRVGPDLSDLGSRLTLGAARVPNTDDHLARWILDPQSLKPGNLMPETPLSDRDLAHLVAYLRSLR